MGQDTSEYADAADKRAKTIAGLSGGMILLLPGFIKNFVIPHEVFWLFGLSAVFAAMSLILATASFMLADANIRRIALGVPPNWPKYHVMYGLSVNAFAAAILMFSAFALMNSSDFTRLELKPVDIVLDKSVAGPEETIELTAVSSNTVEPDAFKWSASSGILFDDNESSVTWLSPSGASDSGWVEITVAVRFGEEEQVESTRVLFISPVARSSETNLYAESLPELSLLNVREVPRHPPVSSRCSSWQADHSRWGARSVTPAFAQTVGRDDFTQWPPYLPIPSLPGPRECCSTSARQWPFCDEMC
ncbi:hypothetical protein ACUN9Y_17940 [Halomonas sp. V046]|uniref:hypothetical protein n=1 Tax=Halomonas sp. V046 TaxID=3459611 RepID=UPI004044F357